MNGGPLVRTLLASAALAAQLLLAGCDTDGGSVATTRSMQPLSPAMIADINQRNMAVESPILVRIFKEESELEVWKTDRTGRFALLKSYPICRWSGELGPKIHEGDRVAPEGFYAITPNLMNPNSNWYLAINLGFPNTYDKANGRDGAFLMIHGDCSSSGCYAMTDEQVAEIYALAREAFFGGQRSFQIQAYPFRMTPLNMARHRNSPHMAFWRMLKEGYDHFELTRQEPKVDVCEKRYVFDAETQGRFTPTAKCPVYQINPALAAALSQKQQSDERQMSDLASRGIPTVPVRTGMDGGMHPIFLAALKSRRSGNQEAMVRDQGLPGTLPSDARPPGAPRGEIATASVTPHNPTVSATATASAQPATQGGSMFGNLFASNASTQQSSPSMLDRMSSMVGVKRAEPPPQVEQAPPAAPPPAPKSKPSQAKPAAAPTQIVAAKGAKQTADAQRPAPRPAEAAAVRNVFPKPADSSESAPSRTANAGLLNGASPTVPAGEFENRFGPWR